MNISKTPFDDITILCVDDEKNILGALMRELRSSGFNVFTAQSASEGLSVLSTENVDIVISDMRMPTMTGIEFFQKVTKHYPAIFRILLSGYTNRQSLIDAINKGNIDRFLEKPWSKEKLNHILTVETKSIRVRRHRIYLQARLKKQNNLLFSLKSNLEKKVEVRTQQVRNIWSKHQQNENSTHNLLLKMIKINPYMDRTYHKAVSAMASLLAKYCKLTPKEIEDIEFAAEVCDIGLLGLDTRALSQPFETLKFAAQQKYLSQIHQVSHIFSSMDGLRNIEAILIHQFEYVNGTGYPSNLSVSEIPMGARILSIARDYWRYRMGKIMVSKMSHEKALSEIKKYGGIRYDLTLIDIVIGKPKISAHVPKISVLKTPYLESGMTLSENVFGNKYDLLLNEGHVLTHKNIESFVRYEQAQNTTLEIAVYP